MIHINSSPGFIFISNSDQVYHTTLVDQSTYNLAERDSTIDISAFKVADLVLTVEEAKVLLKQLAYHIA